MARKARTSFFSDALICSASWSVPPAVYFALQPPKGSPAPLSEIGLAAR